MLLQFFKKRKLLLLVIFLSLIGLSLKILFIWKFSTAFTYDQGRDLLDIRAMVVLGKLSLIGPTTSLHGVFSGPLWYWLAIPFYLITGGSPLSTEFSLLFLSFIMPILVYLLVLDKKLGFILAVIYVFSYNFLASSIVALNTNTMIFLVPLFLLSLTRFLNNGKERFLYLALLLVGISISFEAIIGLLLLPVLVFCILLFGKLKTVLRRPITIIAFFIPFLPQIIFDLRHNFLQTNAILSLLMGRGSSLSAGEGELSFRFSDRLRIYGDVFSNAVGHPILAIIFLVVIIFLIVSFCRIEKKKFAEKDYLLLVVLISLFTIFIGFVFYPFALWPWYLNSVDALMLTLLGLGIYFLLNLGRKFAFLGILLFAGLLFFSFQRYQPWPLVKASTPDVANLRNRLAVVDLIYNDVGGRGMKIFTFAPYVYDYPYQYLIWWRAKTIYNYLPEQYFYLPNQPPYVAAKAEADEQVQTKKSECEYLIIEPYESQKKWFFDWRGRFPEPKTSWEIGKTKIEKLCQ